MRVKPMASPQAHAGVLIDMDGVVAATEALKGEAHVRSCAHFGGRADIDLYRSVMGQSFTAVSRSFREASGLSVPDEAYTAHYGHEYRRLLGTGVAAVPGAVDLLRLLRSEEHTSE